MTAPETTFSTLDRLFDDAPDPALYVPSAGMEQALATVEEALRAGERPVLVTAPPGFGKTLLLRLLEAGGGAPDHFLYVPFLALPAAQMDRWLLGLMGTCAPTGQTFLGHLRTRRKQGGRTILLVDEAQAIPTETAARLDDLDCRSGDGLQLVLAGVEGPALDAALACFATPPLLVPLRAPLTEDDVERTIDGMLHMAFEAREAKAITWLGGLDGAELLRASGGVPRRLRSEMLRRWLAIAGPRPIEPVPSTARVAQDELRAVELRPALEPVPPAVRVRPARSGSLALVSTGLVAALALGLSVLHPDDAPRKPATASVASASHLIAFAAPAPALEEPAAAPIEKLAPAAAPLMVNVNALPWARIRVDDRDLGVTPLGNIPLDPGLHRFEARMSDGRQLHRVVLVGPEQRLVSFR